MLHMEDCPGRQMSEEHKWKEEETNGYKSSPGKFLAFETLNHFVSHWK